LGSVLCGLHEEPHDDYAKEPRGPACLPRGCDGQPRRDAGHYANSPHNCSLVRLPPKHKVKEAAQGCQSGGKEAISLSILGVFDASPRPGPADQMASLLSKLSNGRLLDSVQMLGKDQKCRQSQLHMTQESLNLLTQSSRSGLAQFSHQVAERLKFLLSPAMREQRRLRSTTQYDDLQQSFEFAWKPRTSYLLRILLEQSALHAQQYLSWDSFPVVSFQLLSLLPEILLFLFDFSIAQQTYLVFLALFVIHAIHAKHLSDVLDQNYYVAPHRESLFHHHSQSYTTLTLVLPLTTKV
jgi:hypothetical protein